MSSDILSILSIIAILVSPVIAVQVTQYFNRRRQLDERKLNVFKTLMSTRSANLTPSHIQALNMIDVEFDVKKPPEKEVVEAWKLYLDHLNDKSYPLDNWGARRTELLIDLLHKMGKSLGYDFDKSHIKNSSYYPQGYGETEDDQYIIRKSFVNLLKGETPLPIRIIDGIKTINDDGI